MAKNKMLTFYCEVLNDELLYNKKTSTEKIDAFKKYFFKPLI